MSIGSRIKERREALKLTRAELAQIIGVTPSAIANYENEISSPKIEYMPKLFIALECDANYLHQDDIITIQYKNALSVSEYEDIIKKYRELDEHGKDMVVYMVNKELERTNEIRELGDEISRLKEVENLYNATQTTDLSKLTVDEKVALYRRELEIEEKKAEEKSEVS